MRHLSTLGSRPNPGAASPSAALRQCLETDEVILAPSVFDATSARLAAVSGFSCVHASGGAIARGIGVPDIGLVDLTQMIGRIERIVEAAGVPVVADADDGYGSVLNVKQTVRRMERARIAGFHLEDQQRPKRCGYHSGVRLVELDEMVQKIKAAVDTRSDENLIIIARTDALSVEGFASALGRSCAYLEAGADMIFVEGLTDAASVEACAKDVPGPKLLNAGRPGMPLPVSMDRLKTLGFRIVVYPADLQCAAIKAMANVLAALKRDGHTGAHKADMASLTERDSLVDLNDWEDFERRFGGI